jgi:hypothetical protein
MAAHTDELVMTPAQIEAEVGSESDFEAGDQTDQDDIAPEGLESDADVETTWDEQQDGDEAADDTDAKARKSAPQVRKFKANGKDVDVDMGDQSRVDQLITLGLGARSVFTERDNLKKSLAAKDKQLAEAAKIQKLWNQLEDAKGDHDSLYEKIFGTKFEERALALAKERQDYENASPEERRFLDLQRRLAEAEKSQGQKEADARKRQEALEAKERDAEVREYKAKLSSEFYKHEFSSKVEDPVHAEKLNKILWRQVVADLKSEFGDADEIPADAIRRAFKENASVLSTTIKQQAAKEVKRAVDEKKQTAKQQAQVAATRNYNKRETDEKKLARTSDPVALFKQMFR